MSEEQEVYCDVCHEKFVDTKARRHLVEIGLKLYCVRCWKKRNNL